MLYVLSVMGVLIIYLFISLVCLRSEVKDIRSSLWFLESRLERKIIEAEIEGWQHIPTETQEKIGQVKEMCEIRSNLDRQIRLNAIFCSLDREITIKEALRMLFSYLKLKIKPGDDVKIIKIKKRGGEK